jgi:hypothetical protein
MVSYKGNTITLNANTLVASAATVKTIRGQLRRDAACLLFTELPERLCSRKLGSIEREPESAKRSDSLSNSGLQ